MSQDLFIEYNSFGVDQPGSSRENFWLKGLPFKLTYKTAFEPRLVELYTGSNRNSINTKLDLVEENSTTFTYSEIAGDIGTATYLAGGDYQYGIKFYFRFKVYGANAYKEQINCIWVRIPVTFIEINQCNYLTGYPILFGHLSEEDYELERLPLPIVFGRHCFSSEGVKNYGGAKFVSVIGRNNAENMVYPMIKQPIEGVTEIMLKLRKNEPGIANFAVPPGWPDYSKYFTRITIIFYTSFTATQGSSFDIVLFPARTCVTGSGGGGEGYDSTEDEFERPKLDEEFHITVDPGLPPTSPPPTCSSKTTIVIDEPAGGGEFDQQSETVLVEIWTQTLGKGINLARGFARVIDDKTIEIERKNMEKLDLPEGEEDNLDNPIEGFVVIKENTRTASGTPEIVVYGCNYPPIPEEEITKTPPPPGEKEVTIEIERELDKTKEDGTEKVWTIKYRPDKYSEINELTFDAELTVDEETGKSTLKFDIPENLEGWFKIVNGHEWTRWQEIKIELTEEESIDYDISGLSASADYFSPDGGITFYPVSALIVQLEHNITKEIYYATSASYSFELLNVSTSHSIFFDATDVIEGSEFFRRNVIDGWYLEYTRLRVLKDAAIFSNWQDFVWRGGF